MKKMVCLLVLFLFAFSGCSRKESADGMIITDNETEDVVILIDDGKQTQKAAQEICKMIEAQIVDYKKLEEKDLNLFLEQKELILIGAQEINEQYFEDIDCILELDNMKDKRVSLFFVGEENSFSVWEKRMKKHKNIKTIPSFYMTGEKEKREEEKNRMMGWLTTAFTY